jgi:hypothetical protein
MVRTGDAYHAKWGLGGAEALVDGTWYGVVAFLLGCALIVLAGGMAIASARLHGLATVSV